MSDASETPKIALVGATSMLGKELREQLENAGYPGDAVTLLDLEEAAGLVTEYGEEARVVMEAAEAGLAGHDLVCFCGDPDLSRSHLHAAARTALAIDCTGATASEEDVVMWLPAAGDPPGLTEGTPLALPSDVVLLMAPVLLALGDGDSASFSAFLPASERGGGGLDELARQATAVLNLQEIPEEVFGRQLAFDLWRAPVGDGDDPAVVAVDQLRRLGLPIPALSVFRAPLFHAVSAIAHYPQSDAGDLEDRLRAILAVPEEGDDRPPADSPVRVAGRRGLHLGGAWADAQRGAWLWLMMDNLKARAAATVATLETLVGRPEHRPV